jgi:hypothetical protein
MKLLRSALCGLLAALIVGGAVLAQSGGYPTNPRFISAIIGTSTNCTGARVNGNICVNGSISVYGFTSVSGPNQNAPVQVSPAAYGVFQGSAGGCTLSGANASFSYSSPPSCTRNSAGNYTVTIGVNGASDRTCVASPDTTVTGDTWSIFTHSSAPSTVTVIMASSGAGADGTFALICF